MSSNHPVTIHQVVADEAMDLEPSDEDGEDQGVEAGSEGEDEVPIFRSGRRQMRTSGEGGSGRG